MIGETSATRFTLAVSITIDGTNLLSFVMFKGKPGGKIEKSLREIFPDRILGSMQNK